MFNSSEDQSLTLKNRAARLGPNHGYSIEGDIAILHAEVAMPIDRIAPRGQWALQLWACDAPHAGGPLSGVKVAEATVPAAAAVASRAPLRLDAEALARVPGGQRDYSMVLVLASREAGSLDQVHDFANYPERQRFVTPHLEGSVGYRVDGDQAVLKVERVRSPRRSDNLSGSMVLELWALPASYQGGIPLEGRVLASVAIGRVAGQADLHSIEQRTAFSAPPAGSWRIALLLREWAGVLGHATRDYCVFAVPYTVVIEAPAKKPVEQPVVAKAVEPVAAKPAVEPVAAKPAVEPVAAKPAAEPVAAKPAAEPVVAKPAAEKPAAQKPAPVAARAPADTRVSIMRASLDELSQVEGLTKKLAQEIIKRRPYTSLDELTEVRGIGPKLLVALRPFLVL